MRRWARRGCSDLVWRLLRGRLLRISDRIFEPVPIFGCIFAEDKAGFAIRVITIPVDVAKCFVNAGAIEAVHQGCNRNGCGGRCRVNVWPGGQPAAVIHAAEDSQLRDRAGAEVESGTGQDLGDDGVVDIDVEGCLSLHLVELHHSISLYFKCCFACTGVVSCGDCGGGVTRASHSW